MRTALVILIAVVQVASPWLCSCGAARLSAVVAHHSVSQPVPSTTGCPHCPLCKKGPKSAAPAAPVPADPKPAPAPNYCPCAGVELVAVPAERPAEVVGVFAFAVEPFRFAAFTAPVISHAVASVPGLRELPNLTVDDILYKHHVLRC